MDMHMHTASTHMPTPHAPTHSHTQRPYSHTHSCTLTLALTHARWHTPPVFLPHHTPHAQPLSPSGPVFPDNGWLILSGICHTDDRSPGSSKDVSRPENKHQSFLSHEKFLWPGSSERRKEELKYILNINIPSGHLSSARTALECPESQVKGTQDLIVTDPEPGLRRLVSFTFPTHHWPWVLPRTCAS